MKTFLKICLAVILVGGIGAGIFFGLTPLGKSIINQYNYVMEKVDERTYENQKEVEDTCRSMIASYKADKTAYYQYRDSSSELERSWASGYKARANQTATTYNEYYLKNKYVWRDNVPADIYACLEIITD